MQDFGHMGVTEPQIDLLTVAQSFCREKSPMDKVRALLSEDLGYDLEIWRDIGALGWTAIAISEAYGGVGLSLTEVVPVMEQMGRYMMSTPFLSTTLAGQALHMGGTERQKRWLLPKIAAGEAASLALCELNGDWNLANISATASRVQTQNPEAQTARYQLSGRKIFVLDAMSAHWIIASVRVGQTPCLVILDRANIPDTAFRREKIIDETKRSYELTLDGLTISETDILERDKTAACFHHIHLAGNLLGAAELTGGAQAVIDYTLEYLNTRKQFGKLIGAYQAVKHPTVDAFVGYEKARSLLYAAAISFGEQGKGEIATRMAKAQSDKAMSFAADRSIQFHGGFGFTYDCDAQLYRRRAIFNASQYGDAAYQTQKLADLCF